MLDPGTLAGWLTVTGVVIVAFLVWRGGGGTALTVLTVANDVLEKRIVELTATVSDQQRTIGELRARTDITIALQPLIEAVITHEGLAAERHTQTAGILTTVADRLATMNESNHESK